MNEENSLLGAVLSNPRDNAARVVYADWLEERGDARAAYLRREVELAKFSHLQKKASALRELMAARAGLDPVWLAQLEQPGVLRVVPVPYKPMWVLANLGDYRPVDYYPVGTTYHGCRYETLPPVPAERLTGDFSWLTTRRQRQSQPAQATPISAVDHVRVLAEREQIPLPASFLTFFDNASLVHRLRLCTDCYFNLPEVLLEVPCADGDVVLRFYSDPQGSYHWYLYLTRAGAHCVVGSGSWVGGQRSHTFHHGYRYCGLARGVWHFCSPSFEEFVYRYWIENEIWYSLNLEKKPLTAAQEAYVAHYRSES
jgi:uncharacterized protein (TIGR02996 family)